MFDRQLLTFLFFCFALTSCDPSIGVAISNRTGTNKRVEAHYPSNFGFPFNANNSSSDSITTYDLGVRDNWKHPIKVPILGLDTVARKYSFILQAGHQAIVENRWSAGYPTYGQEFIIDNSDTIRLMKKGTDFKKNFKFVLGGFWTHTIKD